MPPATAVTVPSAAMVATFSSLMDHSPTWAPSGAFITWRRKESPAFFRVKSVRLSRGRSSSQAQVTAQVRSFWPPLPSTWRVMVALPTPQAVTLPSRSTTATSSSLEVKVAA